jgi:KDO2-lipid IV(A) lauroyltransferase
VRLLAGVLPTQVWLSFRPAVFFILYYIIRYRKKVIIKNLTSAFPEKDTQAIIILTRQIYWYLSQLFLESVRLAGINAVEIKKRCHFENLEILDRIINEKKQIVFALGHYGNWEWAGLAMALVCPIPFYSLYKPLKNRYFDAFLKKHRSKTGMRLIAADQAFRQIIQMRDQQFAIAFIADQTPSPENAFWTDFLSQDTPVFKGTAKIAKKLGAAVYFAYIIPQKKAGYYSIRFELLVADASIVDEETISILHTQKLEAIIRKAPQFWLWSHKRWKHSRNL